MSGRPSWEFVESAPFRPILKSLFTRQWQEERAAGGIAALGRRGQRIDTARGLTASHVAGGRTAVTQLYAERFGTSMRTADRHFAWLLSKETVPLFVADRVAVLAGIAGGSAYVIATEGLRVS